MTLVIPPPLALMHNHFFDKLVEHGRCQFGEVGIAFHKLDKLVCFQLISVPAFNLPLPFRYGRFQPGLFLVIFSKKPGKVFIGSENKKGSGLSVKIIAT